MLLWEKPIWNWIEAELFLHVRLGSLVWKCFPTEIKTDHIHNMPGRLCDCKLNRYIKGAEYFHSKGSLESLQTVPLEAEAERMWHFWNMTSLLKDWCPLTGMSQQLPTIRTGRVRDTNYRHWPLDKQYNHSKHKKLQTSSAAKPEKLEQLLRDGDAMWFTSRVMFVHGLLSWVTMQFLMWYLNNDLLRLRKCFPLKQDSRNKR